MQRTEQFLDSYREFASKRQPSADESRPLTALAIDGGGVRGLVPAILLAEIEKLTDKRISSCFDLIAGTSTGGLLALALTARGSDGQPRWRAKELVALYRDCRHTIFRRSLLRVPGTQLIFNKYTARRLERELESRLGDTTLRDAVTPVVIVSWNLTENRPAYFNSAEATNNDGWDLPMHRVARATSAAPTFFKPCWISTPANAPAEAFIDGGVFANNPAKLAFMSLQRIGAGRPLLLVSIGTGDPRPLNPRGRRLWGMLPWATPMLHLFMTAPSELVDVELRELARPDVQYFRFAPEPGSASPHLDCGKPWNIKALERAAAELIERNEADLDAICAQLRARP